MRGTRYLSAWRQTVSDCGSTPATESNSAIAPSSTRSERSTSTVKSTWPGVSMMLIRWSSHSQVVAADVIVMPRSCSCSIQSIVGGALVDLAHLVGAAGVIEDALGRRGLAGVDVGHDPDVAGLLERELARHEEVFRSVVAEKNGPRGPARTSREALPERGSMCRVSPQEVGARMGTGPRGDARL